jgi:hypothetical protein
MRFQPNGWWWALLVMGVGVLVFAHSWAVLILLGIVSVLNLILDGDLLTWWMDRVCRLLHIRNLP